MGMRRPSFCLDKMCVCCVLRLRKCSAARTGALLVAECCANFGFDVKMLSKSQGSCQI